MHAGRQPDARPPGRRAVTHGGGAWVGGLAALAAAVVAWQFPERWCARDAGRWFEGDPALQAALANGVRRLALESPLAENAFHTGVAQFNGEWLFGSYLMAGIGFAQLAEAQPDRRAEFLRLADRCIERLLSPEVRAFDADSWWGEDPLESLDGPHGHAAYLGYINLLLGLQRRLEPATPHAALHDRISAALARRLDAGSTGFLETYPGEVYPIDNAFVLGSLALHVRTAGGRHRPALDRALARFRARAVDPETGLLFQSVSVFDGAAVDAPRGSGTALGLLALRHADPALARDLYDALRRELAGTWLRFGAVREYPRGTGGRGDIDSGPIVFGYGLSATGFALGGARWRGDREYFTRLAATAQLCGAPVRADGRYEFASGGALGNAILFAMLTTPRDAAGAEDAP